MYRSVCQLFFCLISLLLMGNAAEAVQEQVDRVRTTVASEVVKRARAITGYGPGDAPEWEPMNDADRMYVGPVLAHPGNWFLAAKGEPPRVVSEEDLQRLVYDMAFKLRERRKITRLGDGVLPRDLRKWLNRINTSIYGQITLEERNGEFFLNARYNAEARIMAAFRNPDLIGKLEDLEKEVLDVCSWWISENISKGMPNGLKFQRIHDALIDTSTYMQGKHNVADLLLKGQGSCLAYSSALQLMLHMVKIDCRRVCGSRDMNHVWNMVQLNDEWYHTDLCWDDPLSAEPLRMYNYYLLTDVEVETDHKWVNADLYPETPMVNRWHHPMRNHVRRSWYKGRSGYVLPREEDAIPVVLYNMYVKQTGSRAEELTGMFGIDMKRTLKAEEKFMFDRTRRKTYEDDARTQKISRDKKFDPTDIPKRYNSYRPRLTPKKQHGNEQAGITSEKEVNEALEKFTESLAGPRVVLRCKEGMEGWRMREILNLSQINQYAESYNAIFDEREKTISLDLYYWKDVRVLAGIKYPGAALRLTKREGEVIIFCQKWSTKLIKQRSPMSNAHYLQGRLVCHAPCCTSKDCRNKGAVPGMMKDSAGFFLGRFPKKDEGPLTILGTAQCMHVIFTLAGIDSMIVHGRDRAGQQAWTIVRANEREWYHFDAYSEKMEFPCAAHDKPGRLRQAVDSEMQENHAWDCEEIPSSPTAEERDAKKDVKRSVAK